MFIFFQEVVSGKEPRTDNLSQKQEMDESGNSRET